MGYPGFVLDPWRTDYVTPDPSQPAFGFLPADYGSEPSRYEDAQARRLLMRDPALGALRQRIQPTVTPPPAGFVPQTPLPLNAPERYAGEQARRTLARDPRLDAQWISLGPTVTQAPQAAEAPVAARSPQEHGVSPPPTGLFDSLRDLAEAQGGLSPSPLATPSWVPGWDPYSGSSYGVHPPVTPPWADTTVSAPTPSANASQATPGALAQPQTQPRQEGAGGFWGGLLDVLKNVPLSGGGKYSRWQLPSYNQMTAGSRTLDWAKQQGLDVGQVGSVSPAEAQFRVQEAARKRLTDPIGPEMAEQMLPRQPGESASRAAKRAMIAQMPRSQIGPLLTHIVTTEGGLFGGDVDVSESPYANLPSGSATGASATGVSPTPAPAPNATPPAVLPQPPGAAATPPVGQSTVAPMTQVQPQTSAAQPTVAGTPAPQAPGAAQQPQTSAAQPTVAQMPELPQPPQTPGQITREEAMANVETLPTVQAARLKMLQNPDSIKLKAAYRDAQAKAFQQYQADREKRYQDQSRDYANKLQLVTATRQALTAPYGYGTELDKQIRLDYGNVPLGDPRLQAMANAAEPRMRARLEAEKAGETTATTQARIGSEYEAYQQLPLSEYYNAKKITYFDTTNTEAGGRPLPGAMRTGAAAQREAQGTAVSLPEDDRKHMEVLTNAASRVRRVDAMVQQLYDIAGTYGSIMTAADRLSPLDFLARNWSRIAQDHPEVVQLQRLIDISLSDIGKGILGADRNLTEPDMDRLRSMFPNVVDRWKKIGSFGFGTGGLLSGVFHTYAHAPLGTPEAIDSKEVAMSTMDTLKTVLNDKAATLLRTPGFQYQGLTARPEEEVTRTRAQDRADRERAKASAPASTAASGSFLPGPIRAVGEGVQAVVGAVKNVAGGAKRKEAGMEVALRRAQMKAVPDPVADPTGFKALMDVVREQVGRDHKEWSSEQQDDLTRRIAQKYKGTWQPRQPQ